MASTEETKRWGLLIAKAWDDDRLRNRLLSDPRAVLKEHGLEPPQGVEVRVVENTDSVIYLTLPSKPEHDRIDDAQVDRPGAAVALPPRSLPCPWPLCIRCL